MNGSFIDVASDNQILKFDSNMNSNSAGSFGRHEFLKTNPWTAIISIIVLSVASVGGTFGNIVILLSVALCRKVRSVESIFIVNLALSDLYVTSIADPMSIVAKLEGEHFFDSVPKLCQVIASLCTISCVTSLMTIAMMSLNRYTFVCYHQYYARIFSTRNCIFICLSLYFVGFTLVLLNQAGLGHHGFDRRSLECIWDRMATYPYTLVFSILLVWIPCLTVGIWYLRLFLFLRKHNKTMTDHRRRGFGRKRILQPQVVKTIFLIYAVFVICWAPYALLIVIDVNDTFPHEVHVFITTFAHLHPSINWLIYYKTQKKFAKAYGQVLCCRVCRSPRVEEFSTETKLVPSTDGTLNRKRNLFRINEASTDC